jgi:membrane protein implicated in regulation of membrane protease activity
MTEKAKQVGVGAGMFGGAGYTLHLASLGLMLCLIFALATAMAAWLAALVVTVVFVAIAGVLALVGKKRIQKAGPPIPEEAIESVKQTIETVKEEAKWGLGQTR